MWPSTARYPYKTRVSLSTPPTVCAQSQLWLHILRVTLNFIIVELVPIPINYTIKVLKVRRVIDGQAGWLLDGAINYFAIKIARNWPFENISWLLEFFSVLIRRSDLATLITDENTYLQMFTILQGFEK